MELYGIVIFLFLIVAFLTLAKGYKENNELCNDEIKSRHKLLNQNTIIIFELFFLIMTLWFIIFVSSF